MLRNKSFTFAKYTKNEVKKFIFQKHITIQMQSHKTYFGFIITYIASRYLHKKRLTIKQLIVPTKELN